MHLPVRRAMRRPRSPMVPRLDTRGYGVARVGAFAIAPREHPRLPAREGFQATLEPSGAAPVRLAASLVEHRHRRRHSAELPSRRRSFASTSQRSRHSSGGNRRTQLPDLPAGHHRLARQRSAAHRRPRGYRCRSKDPGSDHRGSSCEDRCQHDGVERSAGCATAVGIPAQVITAAIPFTAVRVIPTVVSN